MYSKILRTSIKDFYKNNKFTIRQISIMFKISKSTIGRWINYIEVPRKTKYNRSFILDTIKNIVLKSPNIILRDIQKIFKKDHNYTVSLSMINGCLRQLKLTYKKISNKNHNGNLNQLKQLQEKFRKDIKKIRNNNCICIDEAGF